MKGFLETLFSSNFMPHGYCYLWKPGLVWLHVVSDALIALAYFSIPVTLIYFIRKRRDLPFNWMFVSFGMFILACGTTHTMEVRTLCHGTYWLSGAIKAVTAMASVPTAILLVKLVPEALALPSPEALKLEIAERKRTQEALHQAKNELELKVLERTAELRKANEDLVAEIEDRRRADEALRKAQADLAHVTRVATVGEMTASIAHELNQPLAAVVTNAGAGLRWISGPSPDLEEARQALGRIIKDGNRAGEVIARIRALVKKSPPQKDRLDINETVLEVILLTDTEVRRSRIALQTQLSNDLPLILGDRIQLQQVILNLVKNAIEALAEVSEGPRELLVSSGKDESKGVVVAVRDTGPGLDPKALAHLFDTFYTTKPEGLGMGLAISRSIIEAHGGRLSATPNEPHGTVFQFTLPAEGGRTS